MNAPDAAARFGSGRAVPRIEDRALLEGRGRFTDDVAVPGEARDRLPALAVRACAHRRHRRRRRRGRCPACSASSPAPTWRRPASSRWRRRRTSGAPTDARTVTPLRRAPGARGRALRRRGGRRGRRRDARAGARRARGDRRSTSRSCRRWSTRAAASEPGAPVRHRRSARQHRRRDAPRRRGGDRGGVRARRAPCRARRRQPAPRAGPMEPRSVRRPLRRGERPARGAHQQPDADGRGAAASRPRCPAWRRRRCACWSATSAAASA